MPCTLTLYDLQLYDFIKPTLFNTPNYIKFLKSSRNNAHLINLQRFRNLKKIIFA